MNAALKDAATVGVTILAASGDSLATDGEADGKAHVDYPASNPYVLGCGGTKIVAADSKITAETVWKSNGGGTGGGVSTLFTAPAYQKHVTLSPAPGQKGGRGVPDVAGDADPDSGFRVITQGQEGIIGGTSAVAPLWAGIIAGMNAARGQPLGFIHPVLYTASDAFRDITSGNNKSGSIGFAAGHGWDPCTGLGAPTGALRSKLAEPSS
jgi:kumamolisin